MTLVETIQPLRGGKNSFSYLIYSIAAFGYRSQVSHQTNIITLLQKEQKTGISLNNPKKIIILNELT